jgi:hypothetical protein
MCKLLSNLTVATLLLMAAVFTPAQPMATDPEPPAPSLNMATASEAHTQVRLRKLHLVRPDLIPYPMAYEVYC